MPEVIVPSSQEERQSWRFTTETPSDGWEKADFDDSAWKQGPAGFGRRDTPGAKVRTDWDTADIWIRREFDLDHDPADELGLVIHHDEDTRVYLNGNLIAELSGYTTDYTVIPLDARARKALRRGANVLAVHCHQTIGGQCIDVGMVEFIPPEEE